MSKRKHNAGASLIELIIALSILIVVIGGIALLGARLFAGKNHTDWRADASELRNTLRRHTDCAATMQAATCDGITPVRVQRRGGGLLVAASPQNKVGKLIVNVTCQSGILLATATSPGAIDALTKAPISYTIFGISEHVCLNSIVTGTPSRSVPAIFINKGTVCGMFPNTSYDWSVTTYCPAGYQILGGAPACGWNGGGSVESSYPVMSGTQQGWFGSCCIYGGSGAPGSNLANCYRLNRSGRLDSQ